VSQSSFRINAAVGEVRPLLDVLRVNAPTLLTEFPRPLEAVAKAGADKVSVHVVALEQLSTESIARHLRDEFRRRDARVVEDADALHGFLYCEGFAAFVFVDPSYGEACARFTLAHELGHLVIEYWPRVAPAEQTSLFVGSAASAEPKFMACRDTMLELAPALDRATPAQVRAGRALREVKANAFAAELLAPKDEVIRRVRNVRDRAERVQVVISSFGLSRRAAEIRVDELFPQADPRQGDLGGGHA
jgi:hypothetical protein